METRANYIMVGTFVLILFLGLIGFVLWIARFQGEVAYDRYLIYFPGSVSGLQVGSNVSYRGVTVGEVRDIRIDPDDVERVVVAVSIREDTPIKADTKASLEMQGLAGGVLVMLSGGSNEAPPLAAVSPTRPPVIEAQPSQIERLLQGAPTLVESFEVLVRQASELLSPQNRAAFTATLENARLFSDAVAARSDEIGALIGNAADTMENLDAMSTSLTGLSRQLETQLPKTLENVNAASRNLVRTVDRTGEELRQLVVELQQTARAATSMAQQVEALVAENRMPLRDFTNTGLYEISYLINELRTLIVNLNRLTTEVGRDPARFIFGTQRQGYEAKQ